MTETITSDSLQSFSITETEATINDYDPDYVLKIVKAYEAKLQKQRNTD